MSRRTVKAIAIIIAVAMAVTSLSFIMFLPSAFGADNVYAATTLEEQRYLNLKISELESYIKWIHDNYKDDVDYEKLVNGAFEGAMHSLGDPYSVYYIDEGAGQAFVENATGVYGGVGVTMMIAGGGICKVTALNPGAPADKAGIKVGDQIIKIDGIDVTSKTLSEISAMLRGEVGTNVTAVIKRDSQELSFTMKREKINVVSVNSSMLDGKIGYISLTGFTSEGSSQFKKAKDDLIGQGAASLIIDIRGNGGGMIDTAINIADQIMTSGKDIFHIEQKGKIVETLKTQDNAAISLPIVLLVNENSASASELLAGALQDNKAATLVGVTTYGKGVAQISKETNEGAVYKLSTYYFLTPGKHQIQGKGVEPDFIVRNSLGDLNEEALEAYQGFAPFAEQEKPKAGDTGLNVYAAQQRLALLGYDVEINGAMDEATVQAVKEFQNEQGLYAYGTLDLTTMAKLEAATINYISMSSDEDMQLLKAIEILKN